MEINVQHKECNIIYYWVFVRYYAVHTIDANETLMFNTLEIPRWGNPLKVYSKEENVNNKIRLR